MRYGTGRAEGKRKSESEKRETNYLHRKQSQKATPMTRESITVHYRLLSPPSLLVVPIRPIPRPFPWV